MCVSCALMTSVMACMCHSRGCYCDFVTMVAAPPAAAACHVIICPASRGSRSNSGPASFSNLDSVPSTVRLLRVQGKELDFFIVSEPAWLGQRFPDEAAQVRRPCVALISTDKTWIT